MQVHKTCEPVLELSRKGPSKKLTKERTKIQVVCKLLAYKSQDLDGEVGVASCRHCHGR